MHAQAIMMSAIPTSSGPFSPSDIAGLQLWLKADGNVYNTGTTQATNGQTVQTWADASGNARDATQATSGSRPTFITGALNSKPVIRFDGSDDFLGTASASYAIQTIFVVSKTAVNPNSYVGIITARTSPNSTLVGPSDSNLGFGSFSFGVGLVTVDSDGSGTSGYTNYIGIDGSSMSASDVDNYNVGVTCGVGWHYITHVANSLSASGTKIFCVGADTFSSSRCWNSDIAEIIIYNSAITGTNRTNVEMYLKNKYGL